MMFNHNGCLKPPIGASHQTRFYVREDE